ncbi:MAG: MBL fold metallo-hydrolase [Planctomycetota bacterium]|jgi:hydroxyacylglutathione hydrolase|nr:MBL fold metallo-hydrolase [Planctomycetota bacterium]MDA1202242.1 MBL fold metallo-hydrolase [Planctomycetota bacterium]
MKIEQYYLACLSHASYMITDERTKTAAVVDPQRDIDQYLKDAAAGGYTIKHVFLTHFHADFIAGHIELRDKAGATIHLGSKAEAEFECVQLNDGDAIEFGDVKMEIMETPGHTPEGITILVYDLAKSTTEPLAALTGDTLFIGDVGRPDLLASIGVTADELADMLYESINKLVKLPDATLVYPAHGAGSLCGKALSNETVSTIGEQKKFNYALQPMSREDFKKIVTADQPEAPDYFVHDAILNRKERTALHDAMEKQLKPLPLDEVVAMQQAGAQILDVRDGIDFEGEHLKGAINIALSGKYATWAGSMLTHDKPIVVIAEEGGEEEAVMRLGRIGFDNVAGYLEGGMRALESRPELAERTERITAPALAEWLAGERADAGPTPVVLDIRSEAEHAGGHIAGSLNIPLPSLEERIGEVPAGKPVVVHCAGGYRSAIGASVLQKLGREGVHDLVGGFQAWVATKEPTTAGS